MFQWGLKMKKIYLIISIIYLLNISSFACEDISPKSVLDLFEKALAKMYNQAYGDNRG